MNTQRKVLSAKSYTWMSKNGNTAGGAVKSACDFWLQLLINPVLNLNKGHAFFIQSMRGSVNNNCCLTLGKFIRAAQI